MKDVYKKYWMRHLRIIGILMLVWFVVSFVLGVILADSLDQFRVAGFGLGFWFAQQGSMYVFVGIIFLYVFLTNRLDREFGVSED
jgi:putative solute:sodium symporter small subunit